MIVFFTFILTRDLPLIATDKGTSSYGKIKLSWTAKAPSYYMDIDKLNEQRVCSLKLHNKSVDYQQQPNPGARAQDQTKTRLILPALLVKQRIKHSAKHLSRQKQQARFSIEKEDDVLPDLISPFEEDRIKSSRSISRGLPLQVSRVSESYPTSPPDIFLKKNI